MCGLLTLVSCAQEVMNEEEAETNSRLTVMTRASEEAVVQYPVRLYVFDDNSKCKALQILEDASSQISITLTEGTYGVYAIGGADETRYVVPSKEDANTTSAITLQSGQQLGDLMAGHSTVALSANGSNTLTIGLDRKVLFVKSLVIKNVPTGTSSVSIKIAPLREAVCLDGSYQGTKGAATINLSKQEDGTTWKMLSEDFFLLPSVDKPTITVNVDNTSFSHTFATELEANHQIVIEGSYKPGTPTTPSEVTLTGTISGATWGDDQVIDFNFGDGADEPETPAADAPQVGDIYKGCYVLAVDGDKVTLLSAEEKEIQSMNSKESAIAALNEALLTFNVSNAIGEWRVPNINEAKIIVAQRTQIGEKTSTPFNEKGYYCFKDKGNPVAFIVVNGAFKTGPINVIRYLRPVTTITIQ